VQCSPISPAPDWKDVDVDCGVVVMMVKIDVETTQDWCAQQELQTDNSL
jgi:hypothetical protein